MSAASMPAFQAGRMGSNPITCFRYKTCLSALGCCLQQNQSEPNKKIGTKALNDSKTEGVCQNERTALSCSSGVAPDTET